MTSESQAAAGAVPASVSADAADGAKSTSEHNDDLPSSVIVTKSASEIFHAVEPQVAANVHCATGAEQVGGTIVAGDAHPDATLAIYDFICGNRA